MLLNIEGLGMEKDSPRTRELECFIDKYTPDGLGVTETNVHWKSIPVNHRLPARVDNWGKRVHLSFSYYKDYELIGARQFGGTAIFSLDNGASRAMKKGADPTGMGRWTWTRYRGKDNARFSLRFITAYVPNKNKNGDNTVYNQQVYYYNKQDQDPCPIKTLIDDLCSETKKAMEEGQQIVLALDANQDTRKDYAFQEFTKLGLQEINQHRLGADNLPKTYIKGSRPIDAIFVSSTLLNSTSGYTAFNEVPHGCTHRALWIDIPVSSAFGNFLPETTFHARRLNQSLKVRNNFSKAYTEHVVEHALPEQLYAIQDDAMKGFFTSQHQQQLEDIDEQKMFGLHTANEHCRKLMKGGNPYTLEGGKALFRIRTWHLVKRRAQGFKVNGRYIRKRLLLCNIPFLVLDMDAERAKFHYQKSIASYHKENKDGHKKRFKWLRQLAQERAHASPTPVTTEIEYQKLITREKQRRDARHIKRVNNKLRDSTSVTMVIAPNPADGTRKSCLNKDDIEDACIEEAKRRFWQASSTPFLQPPLLKKVGRLGTGPGGEEILATGKITLDPEDPPLDQYTLDFIKQLKRPDNLIEMPLSEAMITTKKHVAGWKRVNERTSSSDKILHFGHCKVTAQDEELAKFEAAMRNIQFITGYSLKRYRYMVLCEILKKAGEFNVEKLRAICLMEAQFNNGNKHIGRDTLRHGERQRLIAPEQYGCRKNKASNTQALNKKLVEDLIRQICIEAAIGSNDAKSCFDRIVHAIAFLCMRRLGYPAEPLIHMFTTLQEALLHVRTTAGDSDKCIDSSLTDIPISTVYQGNGAGPTIWVVVSTPILNMMRDKKLGARFIAAIDRETCELVGFIFVDDSDLVTTATGTSNMPPEEEVVHRMQESFDNWVGGLNASGGAVSHEKSNWCMAAFKWDENGAPSYKSIAEAPGEVWIRDFDGIRKKLKRIEPNVGDKMLGIRLSMDGNDKDEYEFRLQQAKDWRDRLRAGHLDKHLSWLNLKTTIMKQLEYPLPVTTFTKQQCDKIMGIVLETGLSHSGINHHAPRKLVHGTLKFHGWDIPDLYVSQGIAHISVLLNFGYSLRDPTGQLLRSSAQHMLLELGTGQKLFEHDYTRLNHVVTHSWMRHTWQFFHVYNLQLDSDLPTLKLLCRGDRFLMEDWMRFHTKGLAQLNRCRKYLQVVCLSEIVTADGKYISKSVWEGHRDSAKPTPYHWPKQARPSENSWKIFREVLVSAYGVDRNTLQLATPMASWDQDYPQWPFYFDRHSDRLYEKVGSQWGVHPRRTGNGRNSITYSFHPSHFEQELPISARKASVSTNLSNYKITGISSRRHETPVATQISNSEDDFLSYMQSLPLSKRWAWSPLHIVGSIRGIIQSMQEGNCQCIAVSDGSFKNKYGTASWIIEDGDNIITGDLILPGESASHDSYRSKLGGLYGVIFFITTALEFFFQDKAREFEGTITIGCDGKSALERTFDEGVHVACRHPCSDLVIANRRRLYQFQKLQWHYHHIDSHQDKHTHYEDLDLWAQLNVDCDTRAKAHLRENFSTIPPNHTIFMAPWSLRINHQITVKNIPETLRDHCSGTKTQDYWQKKGRFGSRSREDIDWESQRFALKSLPQGHRREAVKHTSGWFGTGKAMYARKERDTDKCPRCKTFIEDKTHILKCRHEGATSLWNKSMKKLDLWMKKRGTKDQIRIVIIDSMMAWREDSTPNASRFPNSSLHPVYTMQDEIGWEPAIRGFWAVGWAEAQEAYFLSLGKSNSGKRWLSSLIKQFWNICWDLWEHRNGILHSAEDGLAIQELHQQIQLEFAQGFEGFPPSARPATRRTYREVINLQLAAKTAWYQRITAAREYMENNPEDPATLEQRREAIRRERERRQAEARRERDEDNMRSFMTNWVSLI